MWMNWKRVRIFQITAVQSYAYIPSYMYIPNIFSNLTFANPDSETQSDFQLRSPQTCKGRHSGTRTRVQKGPISQLRLDKEEWEKLFQFGLTQVQALKLLQIKREKGKMKKMSVFVILPASTILLIAHSNAEGKGGWGHSWSTWSRFDTLESTTWRTVWSSCEMEFYFFLKFWYPIIY